MFFLLWKVSSTGHGNDQVDYCIIDEWTVKAATKVAQGKIESLKQKGDYPYPEASDFVLLKVGKAIKIS